jgi:uncharacterized protein (TIGR02996 family)
MDHAAFMEAIVNRPDDDTPRLIYADWLEERGDPRGRFVRVQCALERMADNDPRLPSLADEAADLLAAHEAEWIAPLRGYVRDWRFRRGFVDWVDADESWVLAQTAASFASFPVRGICLRFQPRSMPDLAACPHLARIECLSFRGGFLRDRELRELIASPYLDRLTELDMEGHGIETGGVRSLTESRLMPRLRSLDLSKNHAVGDQAARALAAAAGAAGLHTLKLGHTNLTARGVNDLFGSPFLVGLRHLELAAVQQRDLASFIEPIARSPVLNNLTALDLANHPLPLPDFKQLIAVCGRPRFGRLGFANCWLDIGAIAVLGAAPFAGLAALDLRRNRIGSAGLQALAEMPGLASLTELRLGWNEVRDTGVKALALSPHLKRLRTLDLSHNEIGGPGLRALAESANLSGLRELDLSANYVGLESVETLAASPNLARVRSLKLSGNHLGREATSVLAASPTIGRRLRLEMNDAESGAEPTEYSRRA